MTLTKLPLCYGLWWLAFSRNSLYEHEDSAVFEPVHQNMAPVARAKSAVYDMLLWNLEKALI